MGNLSDIVSISITKDSAKITQAGFGIPLILSPRPVWAERVREYTDTDGMITDGFVAGTPEYAAASALFSQNPRPPKILVGRLANKPTQRWAVTPIVANADTYKLTVVDTAGVEHPVSFVSDGTATATEIIAGLKTAIDALGLALTTTDQGTFLRVVANVAGTFFGLYVDNIDKLGIAQDHADPGSAADLDAIKLENDTFYGVLGLANSAAEIAAIAAWTETNKRFFLAASQDSAIATTVLAGATDIAATLRTAAYDRTAVLYYERNHLFADAAWDGRCLPLDPGSETWKFKTLAGIPASKLTATHRANIKAKNANWYEAVAGVNMTAEGTMASGQFIDIVRGTDWLEADMSTGVFGALVKPNKTPYTDGGIATIEAEVRASLQRGVNQGLLAEGSTSVTVPKVANVSSNDKATRVLRNLKFGSTFQGAIHSAQIAGNISV
jgi:hypothetical protein